MRNKMLKLMVGGFLLLFSMLLYAEMAVKTLPDEDCLETGRFLIINNPSESIKILNTCKDSVEKYELLLTAYYTTKDFKQFNEVWLKYAHVLNEDKWKFSIVMLSFLSCGRGNDSWDLCVTAYYNFLIEKSPDNPYIHYYLALYILKDKEVFGDRKNIGDFAVNYARYISKAKILKTCELARIELTKALFLDKAKTLEAPKSFTKQCGKWISPEQNN